MAVEPTRVDPPPADPPEPRYATQEEIAACQTSIEETKASLATMLEKLEKLEQDTPTQQKSALELSRKVQQTRAHLAKLVQASRKLRPPRKSADVPQEPKTVRKTHLGLPVL